MKLTFITNACCVYEQSSYRLLCDPWLSPTAFYGSWEHDPPIKTKPEDLLDVDALYISHLHEDHADPETLKHFRKDIAILTLKDRYGLCRKYLNRLGFTCVQGLENKEHTTTYGPFHITMFGQFTNHPFHDSEIGNIVDSAILVRDVDGNSVLNTNDNMPDEAAAIALRDKYGPITILKLNYNNAGPYPAAFRNLSRDEKLVEHHKAIERNLSHMVAIAKIIEPKYVMPFAGAYKLAAPRAHMNEYLGTASMVSACAYLENHGLKALYMKEGDVFHVN